VLQGPLADWARALARTITEAGEALAANGERSLGESILESLRNCTAAGRPPRAAHLVAELVRFWPRRSPHSVRRASPACLHARAPTAAGCMWHHSALAHRPFGTFCSATVGACVPLLEQACCVPRKRAAACAG
jgi:hypothetical protein